MSFISSPSSSQLSVSGLRSLLWPGSLPRPAGAVLWPVLTGPLAWLYSDHILHTACSAVLGHGRRRIALRRPVCIFVAAQPGLLSWRRGLVSGCRGRGLKKPGPSLWTRNVTRLSSGLGRSQSRVQTGLVAVVSPDGDRVVGPDPVVGPGRVFKNSSGVAIRPTRPPLRRRSRPLSDASLRLRVAFVCLCVAFVLFPCCFRVISVCLRASPFRAPAA